MLTLYSYFRSSTSYRVRIGLNLKGLDYEQETINLVAGEQKSSEYKEVNPQGSVPTLIDDGFTITQSLAILEYLDEKYPEKPFYPKGLEQKTLVRQISDIISCDIHPINNLRILMYLTGELGVGQQQKAEWYQKWILDGFTAIEKLLENSEHHEKDGYCVGDQITMADICLIPQIYNARRFDCPMGDFPLIAKIEEKCLKDSAFIKAIPENQPDTPQELKKSQGMKP